MCDHRVNHPIVIRIKHHPLPRTVWKRTVHAETRQHGNVNGTGGLSSRSVHILHNTIHEALDWAVKQQILAPNVTDAIDAPRFSYKEKH